MFSSLRFPPKTSLREATKLPNSKFIGRSWIHARHHRAINKNSRGFSTPQSELTFAYYSRERLAHGIIATLMIITCDRWIPRRIPAFPCPSASEHRQSRAAAIMHVITDNLLRFHRDRRPSTRCRLRIPLVKAVGITADNNCIPRRWWTIKENLRGNSFSHLVSTFARLRINATAWSGNRDREHSLVAWCYRKQVPHTFPRWWFSEIDFSLEKYVGEFITFLN